MNGSFLLIASLLLAPVAATQQNAKDTAQALLTQGAALFDKHDHTVMTASYMEEGEIRLFIKQQNEPGYKVESRKGLTAIKEGYAEVFKNATPSMKSRNVVESAEYIGDHTLVIKGTFIPDTNKTDHVHFVQVRVKDGGAWKILNMDLYALPQN